MQSALVQAPGYLASTVVSVPGAVVNPSTFWWFSAIMIIVSSTVVIMWLGERITDKGCRKWNLSSHYDRNYSNIPSGSDSRISFILIQLVYFLLSRNCILFLMWLLVLVLLWFKAYVKSQYKWQNLQQADSHDAYWRWSTVASYHLKVNSSGVMPIIFAQAIMFVPLYMTQAESFQNNAFLQSLSDFNGVGYNILFFFMIVAFHIFLYCDNSEPESNG